MPASALQGATVQPGAVLTGFMWRIQPPLCLAPTPAPQPKQFAGIHQALYEREELRFGGPDGIGVDAEEVWPSPSPPPHAQLRLARAALAWAARAARAARAAATASALVDRAVLSASSIQHGSEGGAWPRRGAAGGERCYLTCAAALQLPRHPTPPHPTPPTHTHSQVEILVKEVWHGYSARAPHPPLNDKGITRGVGHLTLTRWVRCNQAALRAACSAS